MKIFGKRRKSGVLGRPRAESSFPGQFDPMDPVDRQELESEKPTSKPGFGLQARRLFGFLIPTRLSVGISKKVQIRAETKDQKKYQDARRKGRFR